MVEYLCIKNWKKFQQYKDREPKWIKVYRELLYDYKYEQLTDAEFGAIVKIWLLASQIDNHIPNDVSFIQRKCGLSQKPNIKKYLQLGFLDLYNSVQNCTNLYLETETETETESESETESSCEQKPKKIFCQNSNEFRLAENLFKLLKELNPNHKKPNLQSWAYEIDKMIRIDKRPVKDIESVISWALADDFWQGNVQSTKKLRKQFDQLIVKMKRGIKNGRKERYGESAEDREKYDSYDEKYARVSG